MFSLPGSRLGGWSESRALCRGICWLQCKVSAPSPSPSPCCPLLSGAIWLLPWVGNHSRGPGWAIYHSGEARCLSMRPDGPWLLGRTAWGVSPSPASLGASSAGLFLFSLSLSLSGTSTPALSKSSVQAGGDSGQCSRNVSFLRAGTLPCPSAGATARTQVWTPHMPARFELLNGRRHREIPCTASPVSAGVRVARRNAGHLGKPMFQMESK